MLLCSIYHYTCEVNVKLTTLWYLAIWYGGCCSCMVVDNTTSPVADQPRYPPCPINFKDTLVAIADRVILLIITISSPFVSPVSGIKTKSTSFYMCPEVEHRRSLLLHVAPCSVDRNVLHVDTLSIFMSSRDHHELWYMLPSTRRGLRVDSVDELEGYSEARRPANCTKPDKSCNKP